MADIRSVRLTRKLLGQFLTNPETIKAFENMTDNSDGMADAITAIQSADVLLLAISDSFDNGRVLSSDGEVQFTDGGPGGTFTIGLSDTGVDAGSYGDASHIPQFSVNAKGRMTLAQVHKLNSDNMTEGAGNLFFTEARARDAVSGGAGITYTAATGEIEAKSAGNAPALPPFIAPTISNPPTQAEVQAVADAVAATNAALTALLALLQANGNLT